MNKIILFFLLFCSSIFSVDVEYLFQKGNEHYKNSEYEQALMCYKSIADANYESPELYYNLANVYYKLKKIGYAILYYEKALKLSPNDEDIKYNLNLAQLQTIDKINPLPEVWAWEIYKSYLNMFSLNGWALISLFFLIFAAISGFFFLYGYKFEIQKYSIIFSFIFSFAFLVAAISTVAKYNYELNEVYGIIVENSVIVKTSPDKKSSDAFILHEGTKAKIQDQIGEWKLIRLADGKTGWIEEKAIEKI